MNLPDISQNQTNSKLQELMTALGIAQHARATNLEDLSLLNANEIAKKLIANSSISLRELWTLIEDDAWWTQNPLQRQRVLDQLIAGEHKATLEARLVRNLCGEPSIVLAEWLATEGHKSVVSQEWKVFCNTINNPYDFACYAANKLMFAEKILTNVGLNLPRKAQATYMHIGQAFLSVRKEGEYCDKLESWLLDHLELLDDNEAANQLIVLLEGLSEDESRLYDQLRVVLLNRFQNASTLSQNNQNRIQRWHNSGIFAKLEGDIYDWILNSTRKTPTQILDTPFNKMLPIEHQARQMWRRLLFFSNYTTHFPDINCSNTQLGSTIPISINMKNTNINILFDLHEDKHILITSKNLSKSSEWQNIRFQPESGWQKLVYHYLKSLNIYPNSGIVKFRGVPDKHLDIHGMPK